MREPRKRHKWKEEICVYCGCVRLTMYREGWKWKIYEYVDAESGLVQSSMKCNSKQLIMIL